MTTHNSRVKFATQVKADILSAVRDLAQSEGRQIQALVEQALGGLLEKRKAGNLCAHIMAAHQASHNT